MRILRKLILFILIQLTIGQKVQAAMFDLNAFYFSDSLSNGTSTTTGRTFYDACLAIAADKKESIYIGWNYAAYSTSDATTTTTTYSSTQMGPKVLWFVNKDKTWRLGFAYNLVTNANYTAGGGTAEAWKGSAYSGDLGYFMPIGGSSNFLMSLRLNYSAASYTSQLVGTTYSVISAKRTIIYPSVGFTVLF